ncbi:MAG: hypothetical protein ACE5HL_05150 [Terriglobia bacterium]
MHKALEEDVITSGDQAARTPASAFVTLDYENSRQFLWHWVKQGADYLETFLARYRTTRSKNLRVEDLKKKFLSDSTLRPAAFFFVYLLHKLRTFERSSSEKLIESEFGGFLLLDLCFGFCLVSDQLIKKEYRRRFRKMKVYFRDLALFLSRSAGLTLDKGKLQKVDGEFRGDLNKAVSDVLAGSVCSITLDPLEADIALCYGIRNQAAHSIASATPLVNRFDEVVQRVLSMLFLSVEELY